MDFRWPPTTALPWAPDLSGGESVVLGALWSRHFGLEILLKFTNCFVARFLDRCETCKTNQWRRLDSLPPYFRSFSKHGGIRGYPRICPSPCFRPSEGAIFFGKICQFRIWPPCLRGLSFIFVIGYKVFARYKVCARAPSPGPIRNANAKFFWVKP